MVGLAEDFGLKTILGAPDTYASDTDEDLQRFDKSAQELENDLNVVLHDIRRSAVSGIEVHFAADFAVMFSALEWFRTRRRESAWARLCFDLDAVPLSVLPGSLFELTRYTEGSAKASVDLPAGAQALREAMARTEAVDLADIFDAYTSLETLAKGSESSRYLATVLGSRLQRIPHGLLEYFDGEMFLNANYLLAAGSRVNRMLNNRVDALDLTIATSVNQRANELKTEIRIVTTASSSRRVAQALSGERPHDLHPLGSLVTRTPRSFAIHELLLAAADRDAQRAQDLVVEAIERVVTYRNEIRRALANLQPSIDATWSTAEDELIRFFGAIGSVDGALRHAEWRREHLMEDDSMETAEQRLTDFLARCRQNLESAYSRRLVRDTVTRAEPQPGKDVRWTPDPRSSKDSISFGMLSLGDEQIARTFVSRGELGVLCSRASLETFITTFGHIRLRCQAMAQAGILTTPSEVHKHQGVITQAWGSDRKVESTNHTWADFRLPIRTLDLAERAGCSPSDLALVRLDTPWFDAAWEDGRVTIVTGQPIYAELADFTHAVLDLQFSPTEAARCLADAFSSVLGYPLTGEGARRP